MQDKERLFVIAIRQRVKELIILGFEMTMHRQHETFSYVKVTCYAQILIILTYSKNNCKP